MITASNSLGTLLRHLTELLDGDVQRVYGKAGLNYRPRYTPVVRVLDAHGPGSVRSLATRTGMTHSAVSQTVAQMAKAGLAAFGTGRDGRERIVSATPTLAAMLPRLQSLWAAADRAAASLEEELPYSLSILVTEAIRALEARSFAERFDDAERLSW